MPEIQDIFAKISVKNIRRIFPNHQPPAQTKNLSGTLADLSLIYRLDFDAQHGVSEVIALFAGLDAVEYVEPSYIYDLFYQPNDPLADTSKIGPRNRAQWGLLQIKAYEAWDLQRGDTSIVIGVVDSGHKGDHEDMTQNLSLNLNDPIDGLDNDGDGYVDNYAGWDFGGNTFGGLGDNDPNVGSGHGFAVAGILGASTDNGVGIAGSSFNCRYLPIKAAPDDSLGAIFYGYEGIVYCVDQGAQIVNCSWGGPENSRFGADVVQYATVNKGAALMVAAGNSRSDKKFYPAAYPLCISVANSHFDDVLFLNSTYNYTVDIAAPGGGILTTFGDNGYATFGGTSAASPLAAGALGIVMAKFDQLTGFQAGQRMRVTADEIYTANDSSIYQDKLGNGRVNLFRALTDPLKPSIRQENYVITDLDGDGRFRGGDTLNVLVDFVNYLHPSQNLSITLTVPDALMSYVRIAAGSLDKGVVNMWDRFSSGQSFQLILDEAIPVNIPLALKINYTDTATTYEDFEFLEFQVNKSWIDITANSFQTSVNSVGNFGFNELGKQDEGLGVLYEGGENVLFEGGFLIGNSPNAVSDRIRNNLGSADQDFTELNLIEEVENPERSDYEARSEFSDAIAVSPLGLTITQHSYAYSDTANDDYLIFQYIIQNPTVGAVNNMYAGLFADWDIISANRNRNSTGFDEIREMVYAKDALGINPKHYGMALLSDQDFHAYATALPNPQFSFSSATKYLALANPPDSATASIGVQNGGLDIGQFISAGPFTVNGFQRDTVAFAVLGGNNLQDLEKNQAAASLAYQCRILDKGPNKDFLYATVTGDLDILFSDQNQGASTWQWDFGDGAGSSLQNPSHIYDSAGTYLVSLQVSDGTCNRTYQQELEFGGSVPIDPIIELPTLTIAPNPARESFSLSLEGNWQGQINLQLFAQDGKLIWEEKTTGASSYSKVIDRRSWAKGIYILRVQHKEFQLSRKLMFE